MFEQRVHRNHIGRCFRIDIDKNSAHSVVVRKEKCLHGAQNALPCVRRLTNVRDFPVPAGHRGAKIEVCVHFQSTIRKGEVL